MCDKILDMKKKIKERITLLSIFLFILIGRLEDYEYHPNYQILENSQAYACYRDGNIYIGDEKFLRSIECNPEDILICDIREAKDSEFKIYDSYKIRDKESRNEIIEVLMHYEKENPSKWCRTKESMRLEWYIHNILHDLNIERDRSSSVDLDNDDEKTYDNKLLRKILKL